MLSVRRISRPLDKSLPSKQVVLIVHQQKLIEPPLGSLDSLLHQPLFVHVKYYKYSDEGK